MFTNFNMSISSIFFVHNNIDVVFLIIDLIVDVIKNIVDNSIKIKMITHCDYFSCNKNDH